MSYLQQFQKHLSDIGQSSSLKQWSDSVNEMLGIYDIEEDQLRQSILDYVPHNLISPEALKKVKDFSSAEMLQFFQDYEFFKNCGKLFIEISKESQMKPQQFEELFKHLDAESRSAEDLKPFLAVMALEEKYENKKILFELLSENPGASYEDVKNMIDKQ